VLDETYEDSKRRIGSGAMKALGEFEVAGYLA
jgi:hypothetical protein